MSSLGTEILENRIYNVEEVAKLLNLNVQTICRALRMGVLIGRKVGKSWLVTEENLKRYLNCSDFMEA